MPYQCVTDMSPSVSPIAEFQLAMKRESEKSSHTCNISNVLKNIVYNGADEYFDKFQMNDVNLDWIKESMLSVLYSVYLVDDPKNSSLKFRFYPTGAQVNTSNYRNDSEPLDNLMC